MTRRSIGESGFYGILCDPLMGYEALAAIMVAHGVRVIQLRMKGAPCSEVLATARAVRRVIPPDVIFIVNDDPQIARDAGADGVHLGQADMRVAEARRIVGPDRVIGLSTHTPDQARAALALGPDYIGVGPVFATPVKARPDPAIGLGGMQAMLAIAAAPAVAIGGIDPGNAGQVLAAGARHIAAVRCVNQGADPGTVIDRFIGLITSNLQRQ